MTFHRLVAANAFLVPGTGSARAQQSAARIRDALYPWYDQEASHGRRYAPVPNLKAETFGASEAQKLATFGEETIGLLFFFSELLDRFGDHLPGRERAFLKQQSDALCGMRMIIAQHKEMGELSVGAAEVSSALPKRALCALAWLFGV